MKTTLLSIIAVLSFGLVGCSNMGTEPTEETAVFATYNPYDQSTQSGQVEERKPDRKDTVNKPRPTIFGDLLVKLNLTPEQKPVVERLLAQHRACVESCVQGLKNAEREILMNARTQEEAIKTKVKNGELTKEQGRLQLRQLREETQIKLKALPKERVRECVKSCDTTFIQQLKEILTPEQKIILEKWVASREKRGTTDDKKPGGRG
jgi:hypothetical protein